MYYVVKFDDSCSIGTIKKDWMIDDNRCIFPSTKNVKKYLKMKSTEANKGNWKIYKCTLKYPKKNGEQGIQELDDAIFKETFYVENSDTDDHEAKAKLKKYLHKHPLAKYDDQLDLNHLITEEMTETKISEMHATSFVDSMSGIEDSMGSQVFNMEISNPGSSFSIVYDADELNNAPADENENDKPSKQFVTQGVQQDTLTVMCNFLNQISVQNETILSQNEVIIREQVSLSAKLAVIEKQLEHLEVNTRSDIDITGFSIKQIENINDFQAFLKKLDEEKVFKAKCVFWLFKNCPKGTSLHAYNGVIKRVIQKLFSIDFIDICGWGSEKSSKDDSNVGKSKRIILSEYATFKQLLFDVLNYKNLHGEFTPDEVAKGVKEKFKRYQRMKAQNSVANDKKSPIDKAKNQQLNHVSA
ncbi:unnamed protein product [Chironomus riparius]|uniref:DUF4806 domain-containing protein n=1 Tax=Chironomus riparius TaxID=315576 RepID=A0A9N9RZQ9_9DIPT|nr:unnamed protein product [Chironomus riparius]